MHAYQMALCVVAVAVFIVAARQGFGTLWCVATLAVAAAIAERGRVRLGTNTEASISLLPTVFAAAVFGPAAAMIVAVVSLAGDFPPFLNPARRDEVLRRGQPYLKWGIYSCARAITAGCAGMAATAAAGGAEGAYTRAALATATAALVAEPLDVVFVALTMRLRGIKSIEPIRALGTVMVASIPLYTPIVAVLAVAYTALSPWTLPLFLGPALAAQRLFGLYQQQRELTDGLIAANERLEHANVSFATALVATLEAKDRYTAGHSASVATYARDIARRLGLSEAEQQAAHVAGLVHDIGKIGLPAGLLEKPGALTLEERKQMEFHPVIGERILANVDTYGEIASVVRHHHERIDGHGYPDGLSGDSIPILARIIAVADAYDAMTSDRPYRDAMPTRVARLRLAQAVDSQFDIAVVAAFEAVLASSSEDYRQGRQTTPVAHDASPTGFERLNLAS